MFSKRKQQELDELTPAAIEAKRKQRSNNRVFGLLLGIAVVLFAVLIYEIVLLF